MQKLRAIAAVAIGTAAIAIPVATGSAQSNGGGNDQGQNDQGNHQIKHVLLISVDGMHQSDLEWYISEHPTSELARLVRGGAEYSNAHASDPSDSDPGGTALMTGGNPKSTGVYYDVEYNHSTYAPGTTTCTGPTGGDAIFDSPDDAIPNVPDYFDPTSGSFPAFDENGSIFPGGVVDAQHLPALIMNLNFSTTTTLNPATFPVDAATCKPIMPWDYLRDNTIFQVIHNAGMRTAWSDKHAVYSSFNGPGSNGMSIDDFFGPEIDSQAVEPNGVPYPEDDDWAHIDAATKQYDGYKVQAVINEIDGFDHSRQTHVGTPAILGMNFQTVSVAEKIKSTPAVLNGPDANGNYTPGPKLPGGYQSVGGQLVPGPLLSSAFDYVNAALTRMVNEIHAKRLAGSTAIIVTAKHGQSPQDPNQLKRIKDGPIIDAINKAYHDQVDSSVSTLIVQGVDDDLWQSYLSVKTQAAADFVKSYLWNHDAYAVTYADTGASCPYPVTTTPVPGCTVVHHSGLAKIYAGQEAAAFFGVPYSNPRYPDVFGRVQIGVVYTGGSKIAEHGGDNPGDRDVPILVYAPGTVEPGSSGQWVETTQVAPTILRLLGLNPNDLRAVRKEGTQVLPGIDQNNQGQQ
jgi:hypothetical protein